MHTLSFQSYQNSIITIYSDTAYQQTHQVAPWLHSFWTNCVIRHIPHPHTHILLFYFDLRPHLKLYPVQGSALVTKSVSVYSKHAVLCVTGIQCRHWYPKQSDTDQLYQYVDHLSNGASLTTLLICIYDIPCSHSHQCLRPTMHWFLLIPRGVTPRISPGIQRMSAGTPRVSPKKSIRFEARDGHNLVCEKHVDFLFVSALGWFSRLMFSSKPMVLIYVVSNS